ncbi:hypothetical protein B0A52_09114 [Exophiala mesophila]|uniref:Asp/Glu/hydantoin racemase n=1 Tax=Exophiala mesophila TaxID=212818 RepID=A0A438MWP5_EXOME|nr:hypothetical protein B0A52_09114 [Exophiala mesophila]
MTDPTDSSSHSQFHPLSLRPGGPSPSTSPQPNLEQQQQHHRQQLHQQPQPQPQRPFASRQLSSSPDLIVDGSDMSNYANQMRRPSGPGNANGSPGPLPPQSPPLPSMALNNQYSSRFPSSQYARASGDTSSQAGPSSPIHDPGNPFSEPPQSRSRSSTFGQNYPIVVGNGPPGQQPGGAAPPMPNSPPQQNPHAQPLVAQHSGFAQPGQGPSSSAASIHSRPVSRGGPSGAGGGPGTRPTSRSPFSTPLTSPPRQRPHQILLINPNSSRSMTEAMLNSLRPVIPAGIEVTGYTAPYPAPTAIESATDGIMSTEAVLRDLAKHAASNGETVQNFDGMIVACFTKHALIEALRESYDVPIVGIMEASLYVARMLGGRFGIVATAARHKIMLDDQVASYGLNHFYVGSEATHLGVLELETRSKDEVAKRVMHSSRALVVKGADTILLGCAGMVDMTRAAKDAVRDEDGRRTVNVIDAVEAGLMMMTSLVSMGIPTSKKGLYKGEKEARRARGQNWL